MSQTLSGIICWYILAVFILFCLPKVYILMHFTIFTCISQILSISHQSICKKNPTWNLNFCSMSHYLQCFDVRSEHLRRFLCGDSWTVMILVLFPGQTVEVEEGQVPSATCTPPSSPVRVEEGTSIRSDGVSLSMSRF